MNKLKLIHALILFVFFCKASPLLKAQLQVDNIYIQRFLELREEIRNPANGYFSPEDAPYHSIETFIIEAPDYGHESTSEVYSYWVWMEAMYGRITGDWSQVTHVWNKIEDHIIPKVADQPNNSLYNPDSPAQYASEHLLPENYPSINESNVPVGADPIAEELEETYGTPHIYGMHWLLDCDNWYGYGNHGDGVSKPSYINTFQRGEQESVWECIAHPSWEDFSFGAEDGGFLPLFVESNDYAQQWRYTNAPDADARVVQAMYWAIEWMKERGGNPNNLELDKTKKMGDYLRYAMFDKYFKPMGCESKNTPGATGYDAMHYLMSWYYAWGGSADDPSSGWAWRIGCSHNHFGYQNPMAAYALSEIDELIPESETGQEHWAISLDRQVEFYTWLQSAEGAIAGGATNSWNGAYDPFPAGISTFYGMAYDAHPVYHDPVSNGWFGWQAWSVQRVAELYYAANDERAKAIMDKWVEWVLPHINLIGEDEYEVPSGLEWTGQPDTWDPENPGDNSDLHVTVTGHNQDVGITASLAKTLIYYAAATQRYTTLHTASRDMARELLDRLWAHRDDLGIGIVEERGDYSRFFETEVYIPDGFTGTMANGDVLEPGVTFSDIRTKYFDDPAYPDVLAAYEAGEPYSTTYHRTWAQMEIALACADFGYFFPMVGDNFLPTVAITSPLEGAKFLPGANITINANASDLDGTVTKVDFYANEILLGSSTSSPFSYAWNSVTDGEYVLRAEAIDDSGDTNTSIIVNITVGNSAPEAAISASPLSGVAPFEVEFDASASTDYDGDDLSFTWNFKDNTPNGNGAVITHTFTDRGEYMVVVTVDDGNGGTDEDSIMITVYDQSDCNLFINYGLPASSALGTMNTSFSNVHILGEGGPDMSNVTGMSINWSLQNNGLYQFSLSTSDGNPSYYVDLASSITGNTLGQSNPALTFNSTGFSGFQGTYYVGSGSGYLILVHEDNTHALYFTDDATPPAMCSNNGDECDDDTEDPEITSSHTDLTVDGDLDGMFELPDYSATATASDNCDDDVSITQSPVAGTEITGDNNIITLTATDNAGNTISETFSIDVTAPVAPEIISNHPNVELSSNSNCEAILPDYTDDIELSGSTVGVTYEQTPSAGTLISGTGNIITLTARLSATLFDEVTFEVSVVDNTDPVFATTFNNVLIEGNASGEASLPDYTVTVSATDNCDDNLTITQSPIAGTIVSGNGNTVTVTATDDAGNTASESFIVNVSVEGAPVITSTHNNAEISSNSSCEAILPDYTSEVEIAGGSAGITVTQLPAAGSAISGTSNEVTLTATNQQGLSTSITFNISVVDESAPQITAIPSRQSLNGDANDEAVLPDYTDQVVATDNCDATVTITQSPVAGTVISGNNTITIIASDDDGNEASETFVVSVAASAAPVFMSNHSDVEINETGNCSSQLPDYTSTVEIDGGNTGITISQGPLAGTTISGTATVTLTATNVAGKSSSVSFEVSVLDEVNPVITSTHSNKELVANAEGVATLPNYTSQVVATDNCDDNLTITQSPAAGFGVTENNTQITLTATDDAGNSASKTFFVSISDPLKPIITSVHNNVEVTADGNCESVLLNYTEDITVQGDASVFKYTQTPPAGSIISGRTNAVTLTVSNYLGEKSSVSFNVAVVDRTAPVINSSFEKQILIGKSSGKASLPDYTKAISASDNCTYDLKITQQPEAGKIVSGDNTEVRITVADDANNIATQTFIVGVTASSSVTGETTDIISVYPNPTTGVVSVEGSGINKVVVYDIAGKVVETVFVNNDKAALDLSNNTKGMYIIKTHSLQGVFTSKIMLE